MEKIVEFVKECQFLAQGDHEYDYKKVVVDVMKKARSTYEEYLKDIKDKSTAVSVETEITDNEKIAEMLGFVLDENDGTKFWFDANQVMSESIREANKGNFYKKLLFDSDYNWLMIAVGHLVDVVSDIDEPDFSDESFMGTDSIMSDLFNGHEPSSILEDIILFLDSVKWIETDPSCNQYCRKITDDLYELKEDRIVNPETKETEVFQMKIRISEYSEKEINDAMKHFGYSEDDIEEYISSEEYQIIAECLFELEN